MMDPIPDRGKRKNAVGDLEEPDNGKAPYVALSSTDIYKQVEEKLKNFEDNVLAKQFSDISTEFRTLKEEILASFIQQFSKYLELEQCGYENRKLRDENNKLREDRHKEKLTKEGIEKDFNQLKRDKEELRSELLRVKESTKNTLNALEKTTEQKEDILRRYQQRYEEIEQKYKEAEEAKNDALSRLSRQMGEQLSEGNPNIADLSDLDRPTKLGERYNELYDNEWTNALDYLLDVSKGNKDEEEAIELLYYLLTECHIFCGRKLEEQMDLLERDLLFSDQMESNVKDTNLSSGVRKTLKQARKSTSANAYENLLKRFYRHLSAHGKISLMELQSVKTYTEECFKLSYQMCLHDPPLSLGSKPARDESFDGNTYKEYTVSGTKIDFVVLPPLYLHKGGPLLCKGVAQPVKSAGKRKKASKSEPDRQPDRDTLRPDEFSHRKSKDLYIVEEDKNKTSANETRNSWSESANVNTSHETGIHVHSLSTQKYITDPQMSSHYKTSPLDRGIPVQHGFKTTSAKSSAFQHINPHSNSPLYPLTNTEQGEFLDILGMQREAQCRKIRSQQFVDVFNERENRDEPGLLLEQTRMQGTLERERNLLENHTTELQARKRLDQLRRGNAEREAEKNQRKWRMQAAIRPYLAQYDEAGRSQGHYEQAELGHVHEREDRRRHEQKLGDKLIHEMKLERLKREHGCLKKHLRREQERGAHNQERKTRGNVKRPQIRQDPLRSEQERLEFEQELAQKRRERQRQEQQRRFRKRREHEKQVRERFEQIQREQERRAQCCDLLKEASKSAASLNSERTKTSHEKPWR